MDVERIVDDNGISTMGYLVKGHITDEELEAAVRQQEWEEFEMKFATTVERTVMRKVPSRWHETWSFTYEYSEPGHGAFKCTIAWLE